MTSKRTLKMRMKKIISALAETYPEVVCPLDFDDPWECTVSTILSAQCTDKKVNEVTPGLFKKYPTVESFAGAKVVQVEKAIHSIGLYKAKAKNIVGAAKMVLEKYEGKVPDEIDELVKLPGVGRKTANCVVLNAYGKPGIMCDTHCCRVTRRIGLHDSDDPVKIEYALGELMPREEWGAFSHRVIIHGRQVCHARKPNCDVCSIRRWCETGGMKAIDLPGLPEPAKG
ncbi:MAG: endonuclease III [Planctomycetes bacterium]|nr:endonuclease III [Planctomycetota bacterium]